MSNVVIHRDPEAMADRLAAFSLTEQDAFEVVWAALQARRDTTENHAANAAGTYAYHEGLRALRDILLPKGWVRDNELNIESVIDLGLGVRIVFQNVDVATQDRPPRAISGKGPAAERMVDKSMPYLFDDMESERQSRLRRAEKAQGCEVWFLCVSEHGQAELSRPMEIVGGQFGEFVERIFIVTDEYWESIPGIGQNSDRDSGAGDGEAFEPEISPKQGRDV